MLAMAATKTPRFRITTATVAQIRHVMGNVHCGEPETKVRAFAEKKLKGAKWMGKPLTAPQKAKVVNVFLKAHKANQDLYCMVMTGRTRK
jgi:hypothetical protein